MKDNLLPQLGETGRILEGVVTTINEDGTLNISPMGPIVDEPIDRLVLRPYQTSTTFTNLKRTGQGVFHVTDDVLLIAKAAVGKIDPVPPTFPATKIEGSVLADACRWVEFQVETIDERDERTQIIARNVGEGRQRDFFGFNRAKHAVIEAAILATRLRMISAEEISEEFRRLENLVFKTGSQAEHEAFALLKEFVEETDAPSLCEVQP